MLPSYFQWPCHTYLALGGSKNTSHSKWYYISALSITLHKTKTAFLMLAKVRCISWVIGLLMLSGGLFAQGKWDREPPDLSRGEWKHLRSLRKVRPLFWIGPLRNEAVYGICLTPIGFREHYNAVVNGLNLEVLGIGTVATAFSLSALSAMARSLASMDTIPEVYNFQVNGVSLGSGFVQRGVLNGIGVGGGLIGKLNGISVGVVNLMYRANGLMIGFVGNEIAEMRGLEIAFINGVEFRMRGVQLALFGNVVRFTMHGIQVAFFGNDVGFRMRGVQVALFGNVVSNDRILKDSLPNKEKELIGLQVGGLNTVSYSALGMQIGFRNWVLGKHEGIQMGLWNKGNTLQGVQIGLINDCSSLRGVQIGLLNSCEGKLSPFLRVKLKDRRLTTSEPSSEPLP